MNWRGALVAIGNRSLVSDYRFVQVKKCIRAKSGVTAEFYT
jgi:hypothetical protein